MANVMGIDCKERIEYSARNRREGFSLVEAALATAIFSVVVLASANLLSTLGKYSHVYDAVVVRDDIQRSIMSAVLSREALQVTRQHNVDFSECFKAGSGGSCESGRNYGLELYDSRGDLIAGPGVSGSGKEVPVFYDRGGRRCAGTTTKSPDCPFAVTASFRAQGFPQKCPGCRGILPVVVAAPGERQEFVEISYSIVADDPTKIALADSSGSMIWDLGELGL